MKNKIVTLTVAFALMTAFPLIVGCKKTQARAKVSAKAPDFVLPDTYAKKHKLSDHQGKFVVLEWLNHDCPFVEKHYDSGNMQSLQKEFTKKGVVWFSINSSAKKKQGNYPPDKANQMTKAKKAAPTAVLIDESGAVGRLYGAKTTPHMFVINPEGILVYQGAIDSIDSTDVKDIPKAKNYVYEALNFAMTGKPIAQASTTAYGCSVKY